MCMSRVFVSGPNPCLLRQIPVIIYQSLRTPLQVACFYAEVFFWVRTRECHPVRLLWGVVCLARNSDYIIYIFPFLFELQVGFCTCSVVLFFFESDTFILKRCLNPHLQFFCFVR